MRLRVLLPLLTATALAGGTAGAARADDPVPVAPRHETPAAFDDEAGRNADSDDPAVWVNPVFRSRSFFVGTKKDAGLAAYDLQGRLLQDVPAPPAPREDSPAGRFNNAEVLRGVRVGRHRRVDVAVVTDRGRDQLRTYAIDPVAATLRRAPLRDVTAPDAPLVFSASHDEADDQATAYGLASFVSHGTGYLVVSRRSRTELALLELIPTGGAFTYAEVDRTSVPKEYALPDGATWTPCEDPGDDPQVEGMVVDPRRGLLFAGQEDVGIHRIGVGPAGFTSAPVLQERVREFRVPGTYDEDTEECELGEDPGFGGTTISADVEGLTIGAGLLLASSQGDNTFAVFGDRGLGAYQGSFELTDGAATDGVQESDGAQLVSTYLGRGYPFGVLVTQDGDDEPAVEGRGDATDFKLTPWHDVAFAFSPPLPAPLTLRLDGEAGR